MIANDGWPPSEVGQLQEEKRYPPSDAGTRYKPLLLFLADGLRGPIPTLQMAFPAYIGENSTVKNSCIQGSDEPRFARLESIPGLSQFPLLLFFSGLFM